MIYAAVAVLLAVVGGVCAYTDVDNNFSYEKVAEDPVQLKHHLDCFLGKEECSSVAAHYKSHIMDTLKDDCRYCTPQHKHNAKMFLHGIKEKFPDGYKEIKQKYDPDDKLFRLFEDTVEKF